MAKRKPGCVFYADEKECGSNAVTANNDPEPLCRFHLKDYHRWTREIFRTLPENQDTSGIAMLRIGVVLQPDP